MSQNHYWSIEPVPVLVLRELVSLSMPSPLSWLSRFSQLLFLKSRSSAVNVRQ
ncbi:hypothetical protein [Streptomyces africanus]|uniref:hypothetical protein n=1 Tax=Streptomyces africanus TaxID=231024 RepID=UPI001302BFD9|nr:hypothetical protein [Streptomyces africanus]